MKRNTFELVHIEARTHTTENGQPTLLELETMPDLEAWLNKVDLSTISLGLRELLYVYCRFDVDMLGPKSTLHAAAEKFKTPIEDEE